MGKVNNEEMENIEISVEESDSELIVRLKEIIEQRTINYPI